MPNTTNFNWATPADTDLVKDGASAIRTLGNSIDTSFVDLKGGTTGQVLAKNSNTDLDFVWSSDQVGIPASIVDAKGDIIAATAADTVSRLAVGTNGQLLTADSTAATGLAWTTLSSGGMTLIATNNFSSGTSTSFSSIPSTYKHLRLQFIGIGGSASSAQLTCTFNSSSSAVYSWGSLRWTAGVASSNGSNLDSSLNVFGGQVVPNNTLGTLSGYMEIYNYQDTSRNKSGTTIGAGSDASASSNRTWGSTAFTVVSTTTISSIQISANNAMGGTGVVQLWGIA